MKLFSVKSWILDVREEDLRKYLEVFSTEDTYYFDSRGLNPGRKILPRIARYWSLNYVGKVYKISLRDQELFFSDRYVIPYSTEPGVWIYHDVEEEETVLSDPDLLSRDILPTHSEF